MTESYISHEGSLTQLERQQLCKEGSKTMKLLPEQVWNNPTVVVRTTDGKLAGAVALVHIGPNVIELGPLVILPGYRSGKAVRNLLSAAIEVAGTNHVYWVSHHPKADRITYVFPQLRKANIFVLTLMLAARISLLMKSHKSITT